MLKALPLHKRWQQQRYPVASVVAILSRVIGGVEKHLLIHPKKQPYTGKSALPGGKWDFGESLAEAVLREVNEEPGFRRLSPTRSRNHRRRRRRDLGRAFEDKTVRSHVL